MTFLGTNAIASFTTDTIFGISNGDYLVFDIFIFVNEFAKFIYLESRDTHDERLYWVHLFSDRKFSLFMTNFENL